MRATDHATCTLCSGGSRPVADIGDYRYWRCEDCAFIFLWPMPSDEDLATYYNTRYRSATSSHYPKARSRAWRAFWKSLRFSPYVAGSRTLDVGCGGGFMASAFSRLARHSTGLDISEESINFARQRFPKIDFYCENFNDFMARGLKFDFIFSSELLEHIPSPWPFMEMLQTVSTKGSHVYIATPDAGHPSVPVHLSDWNEFVPPEHVQFFNRSNIVHMFAQYGFVLKKAWSKRSAAHSLLFIKAEK